MPADVHRKHLRDASPDEGVASTVILYFGPNAIFVRDECWITRKRTIHCHQ
jgi:hypothetical protein